MDEGLETLIQSALEVKISAKKMKKWEKEYSQFKSKEDEELVESRRLKTENKLLKQRIDHLEKVRIPTPSTHPLYPPPPPTPSTHLLHLPPLPTSSTHLLYPSPLPTPSTHLLYFLVDLIKLNNFPNCVDE